VKDELLAQLLANGQGIIVEELSKIDAFKRSVRRLAGEFRDIALAIDDMEDPPLEVTVPERGLHRDRVLDYVGNLRELANSYNLRCGWIINGLHHIVRSTIDRELKAPITGWNARIDLEIDRLRLDIPVRSNTRKKDVRRVLDQKWKELESRHPELKWRRRMPTRFPLHVRWLCQRLFDGRTGANIEPIDPDDPNKDLSSDYIDVMIRRTARLLGITLPRGRPHKNTKEIS